MTIVGSPRNVAAVLFVTGLMIGTAAGWLDTRQPLRVGDYWVLGGDFHVHAFPGDGALSPWALRDEARHAGLDIVAVTNHNQLLAGRLARWIAGDDGPIVLVGQEVTNPDYHLIAVGIEKVIRSDQPVAAAIDDIHAQGGVAIAAHPVRTFQGYDEKAIARLDGTEGAHPMMQVNSAARIDITDFFAHARSLNPDIAAIGSSDVHVSTSVGECRTLVFTRERTAAGVIDAIRRGMTIAIDRSGERTSRPDLEALLKQSGQAGVDLEQRPDPHPRWRRLALTLTWTGLIGLVMAGSRWTRVRVSASDER